MPVLSSVNRYRRRRVSGLASLVSVLAVGLMVLAAVGIGRFSLHSAELDRLNERGRLVRNLANFVGVTYDPDVLQASAARTPFPQDKPAVAARLLEQFRTGPTGDSAVLAALVRVDGTLVVSSPAGVTPPTTELGAAWSDPVSGSARRSSAFVYRGKPSWAMVAPVGSGKPWAVLIVIENSINTSAQTFAHQLGAIAGSGAGGLSETDDAGHAVISWNPDLLGTRLIDPALIDRQPVGVPVTSVGGGAGQVTTIAVRSADGTASIFRQDTSALFADLEDQQRRRDLTLLGVLAVAVGGLVLASVLRVRAVRRNRARLHTLLSSTEDLIVVVAPDTTLTFVSPTVQTLLGFDPDGWLNHPLLGFTHPADAERLTRLIGDPDGVRTVLDIRLHAKDGDYRWFDIEAGDVTAAPELRGVLLTCHSVGERKALQDELFFQGRHDVLTGLPNRGVYNERLEAFNRAGELGCTVLFIDLDRFKHVNDQYGHEAGDQVLHAVAERLTALVRAGDLVCRFGGDEFGIVLPGATQANAQHIADRIVAVLSEPITIGRGTGPDRPGGASTSISAGQSTTVAIGASVGIAMAGPGLNDPEALLHAADGAMYRAKELGRGRAVMWGIGVGSALAVAPVMAPDGRPEPIVEAGSVPAELVTATATATAAGARLPNVVDGTWSRAGNGREAGNRNARSWRGRIRSLASLGVVSLAIISVAGLGVWQSSQARQVDERQRISERLALTLRVAGYAAEFANLQRLIKPVSDAPWALDGSIVDVLVVRGVLSSDLASASAEAILWTTSGKVLAATSTNPRSAILLGSQPWRNAVEGGIGLRGLDEVNGSYTETYAIPVMRAGKVAAILTVDQELKSSVSEKLLLSLGSLGFGEGGVSSVVPDGRGNHSWNAALIGQQVVPKSAVGNLPVGRAVIVDAAKEQVTLAALVSTPPGSPRLAMVFQQPTSVFYGDLNSGQRSRDVALFAVVAVAIGLLGAARWQQEQALHRSEKHLDALLRYAHDILIVVAGVDADATFISSAITGLLGHRPGQWLDRPLAGLVHPEDRGRLDQYTRTLDKPSAGTLHDLRLLAADGSYRWFDLHATDLTDRPEVAGILFTCHEVGERKTLQAELSHRARHDALTGLPNRAVFNHHLDAINHTGTGTEPAGYTVLFIDLDRFKPVNDTFGHDAGDDVLRSVAHRLATSASHTHDSLICRLGGDEFAILLPGTDPSTATHLANDILQRVRQPITIRGTTGQAVQIGATIGIAYAQPTDNPATIVKRADQAMYQAKDSGRGQYAIHTG